MTRNGKIARLSHSIRELLNQRLYDGEQGKALVEWLNGLPKEKEVLQWQFHGQPISEQNLSEWKTGGFKEWERHHEDRHWVQQLAEQADDLEEDAGDFSVNDRLSVGLMLALGRSIQVIAAKTDNDPARLRLLLHALHEISLQRRCDHSAQRLRLEEARWDAEQEAKKDALFTKMDAETEAAECCSNLTSAFCANSTRRGNSKAISQATTKLVIGTRSPGPKLFSMNRA